MNKVWIAVIAAVVIIVFVVSFVFYKRKTKKYNDILDDGPEEFKERSVSFADEHGLPLDDSISVEEIEKTTAALYPTDEEMTQVVDVRDTATPEPVIDMPTFHISGMGHNIRTDRQVSNDIPKYTSLIGINRHEMPGESELEEKDLSDEPMGMLKRTSRPTIQPIKPRMSLGMRMMGADKAAAMIHEFEKKPEDMKQANMVLAKVEEKKQQTKTKKTKADRKHRKSKK